MLLESSSAGPGGLWGRCCMPHVYFRSGRVEAKQGAEPSHTMTVDQMAGLGREKGTDRTKGLSVVLSPHPREVLLGGSDTKNALVRWLFIC